MTKKEFQIKWNISDDMMKEIEIVFKLFHGKEMTVKDYDWIKGKLRNGKQEVDVRSKYL